MKISISGTPPGALWPNEESNSSTGRAMAIAILAAVAIEGALIAGVMSVRVPATPMPVMPVMQMRLVQTVTPTPPPPPPPVIKKIVKQQSETPVPKPIARPAAPARAHVAPTPTQEAPSPVQAAPSAPTAAPAAATPAPAATPGPTAAGPAEPADIAIVCPVQAKPELPARALAEGIVGAVTARATIQGGKVVRVDIVDSTPRSVFDASVRRAMAQYRCKVDGDGPVVVEQSFDFTQTDE
jgi:protein TonB